MIHYKRRKKKGIRRKIIRKMGNKV